MVDHRSRVTIFSVGVWQYHHMPRLTGPQQDVQNLRRILTQDQGIALFRPHQYQELNNPTSEQLRQSVNTYVYNRGADNDILIFYFSGHGSPVGANDFAFCTVDTQPMIEEQTILPMTAVSFSDILRTLWIKQVVPIFIIDACYSGAAGGALHVTVSQMVDTLKGEIQRRYASSYALLCSAPNDEQVRDNPDGAGGFFSSNICDLIQKGINKRDKKTKSITLGTLFNPLRSRAETSAISPIPMLFLGPTLPEFSIANNVHYSPLEYHLQPHLVAVLRVLWNDGQPKALKPNEIAGLTKITGPYGNHKKLSFRSWDLVETVNKKRQLTQRGMDFMRGELKVPRDVLQDRETHEDYPKPGTDMVGIQDF